jgi:aspartyl-tRNA(Asn)/glutamyl-tRNA(Gln) amidotransferase subunit C
VTLTRKDVEHIAALAHLELADAEHSRDEAIALYQEQLSAILDYAERLQALDTEAIPPTATVLPLRTVLREDKVREPLGQEEALANGPETQDGCFVVPPPW